MINIQKTSDGMIKKRLAFSVAKFILEEIEPESRQTPVEMYMKWKQMKNISLHYPQNAKYALDLFEKLGHLSEDDRSALATTVEIEADCLKRNI